MPISFGCLLATESVNAVILPACVMVNKGSLEPQELEASIAFIAATRHIGKLPKSGMAVVLVSFLSCKVLDHLISMVAPIPEKNISPLHRCLETSKLAEECGRMFEIQRNEEKAKVYSETNILKCGK